MFAVGNCGGFMREVLTDGNDPFADFATAMCRSIVSDFVLEPASQQIDVHFIQATLTGVIQSIG